jgi:hypothetical protein
MIAACSGLNNRSPLAIRRISSGPHFDFMIPTGKCESEPNKRCPSSWAMAWAISCS